jgi:hypothetical protein
MWMDLQKLVHLEISPNCLEIYQQLDDHDSTGSNKRRHKALIIRVINPIQLLASSNDEVMRSYLNSMNAIKHSLHPTLSSPPSSQHLQTTSLSYTFSKAFR